MVAKARYPDLTLFCAWRRHHSNVPPDHFSSLLYGVAYSPFPWNGRKSKIHNQERTVPTNLQPDSYRYFRPELWPLPGSSDSTSWHPSIVSESCVYGAGHLKSAPRGNSFGLHNTHKWCAFATVTSKMATRCNLKSNISAGVALIKIKEYRAIEECLPKASIKPYLSKAVVAVENFRKSFLS
ncbi:hypothetical protein B9Z19DRAFT_580224 [Tuber borchii]|uniref:Uncharacterized protein n=1 Tax=Tuber borchii TaxID=42251 RepID=A0A2T6ZC32_TUBBO|nr:hypothetical protein B9Z19DRAFT_580224 [Tuber borchii]